jgi:hypothetical protein
VGSPPGPPLLKGGMGAVQQNVDNALFDTLPARSGSGDIAPIVILGILRRRWQERIWRVLGPRIRSVASGFFLMCMCATPGIVYDVSL